MKLKEHYDNLYKESLEKILSDDYQVDRLLDSSTDNRYGITLLVHPAEQVKANIQSFLGELREIEPEQYYYPDSDMHITVMSIISCFEGFDLRTIPTPSYIELIGRSIKEKPKIEISFKGVTASSSCIMLQGFPSDESLQNIRNALRKNFRESGLQQSIDKRYAIQTAHATVVRFRKPLAQKQKFLQILEKYRHHDFGTFQVEELELVHNDWYQRERFVQSLHRFKLSIKHPPASP